MLVYSIIFLLLLFGVFHYDYRKEVFLKKGYYFFVFLVMTAMTALRYRVGGDSLMYEDYYRYLPDLANLRHFISGDVTFSYQPLYLLYVALCKAVGSDYYVYQAIHALTVNLVFFWFIRRQTKYQFTVLFILYLFLFYFYFTFEVQREVLAICCFLLAYRSFEKNRWLKYYLFAVAGFFFHISAFILLLLPFFKLIKFTPRFMILTLMITFPLIFLKSFLFGFFEIFFFTETMQKKGDVYAEMEFSIVGLLFFYFVRVIINLPFLWTGSKNNRDQHWLLAAVLILSVSSQIMVGFDRFLNYLYIPYVIFVVESIYTKFGQTDLIPFKRKFIVFLVAVNLFFVLAYKVFMDIAVTDRARYQAVFFPYESIFDKERHMERENFMIELWKRK